MNTDKKMAVVCGVGILFFLFLFLGLDTKPSKPIDSCWKREAEGYNRGYQDGLDWAANPRSSQYDEAYYDGHEDACSNPKRECR